MMNASSLLVQTQPSGICLQARFDVGGGSALLLCAQCYPHSFNKSITANVEMLLLLRSLRPSHIVKLKQYVRLAVVTVPHRSGLEPELDRPWSSHPPNGPRLFHKNFHLEKILHSNREGKKGEKSHEAGHSPIPAVEKPLESS